MSQLEMEFHMINITYAVLHVRPQTKKTTFSCKDDCTLTKTHIAGHIPLCGIFNLRIQNMEARWPICLIQALNSCLIWFWEQSCFCPPLLNCFFWKTITLRVLEIEYFSDNRQLINIGLMFSMISPFSDLIHIVGCQKDTSYYQ